MLRKGLDLAATSIVGLLVLTVGLEVLTGLIAVPADASGLAVGVGVGLVGAAFALIVLAFPADDPDDGRRGDRPAN